MSEASLFLAAILVWVGTSTVLCILNFSMRPYLNTAGLLEQWRCWARRVLWDNRCGKGGEDHGDD
jgi:hypothetical protein